MASDATHFQSPVTISLRRVFFISQKRAEKMHPPADCALISITDSKKAPAKLQDGWSAVLRVSFDDIDPISYPDDYDDMQELSSEQSEQMAEFCLANVLICRRLVVHCRYGVSRSAAVAKALCESTGLWFPAHYEDHNDLVYRSLLSAIRDVFPRSTQLA